MASLNGTTHYICLFHDADRARAAVSALERLGVAREQIDTLGAGGNSAGIAGPERLTELGVPQRDLQHLQDGLRRGSVLISLQAPESQSNAIEKVFHHYTAEKIDETEVETSAGLPLTAGVADTDIAGQAVIPVAQEELQVGKREVERGGVRVYRRTVEERVSEDVNLHDERVVLEYREVNRPVTEADIRAGSQQIELVETAEVPVVQKVARVVEEVHVGKVESDHTEVIQDTVRHTEVDVEQVAPASPAGMRAVRD